MISGIISSPDQLRLPLGEPAWDVWVKFNKPRWLADDEQSIIQICAAFCIARLQWYHDKPLHVHVIFRGMLLRNPGVWRQYGSAHQLTDGSYVIILWRAPIWKMLKSLCHELRHVSQMQRGLLDYMSHDKYKKYDIKKLMNDGDLDVDTAEWQKYKETWSEVDAYQAEGTLFHEFEIEWNSQFMGVEPDSAALYVFQRWQRRLVRKITKWEVDFLSWVWFKRKPSRRRPIST
jgi:hypothetical protein